MGLELIDPDPAYTAFWITGGADSDYFLIDSGTGELSFSGDDFEAWADADGDNVFEVEVTASGGGDKLKTLSALSGRAFDKAYVDNEVAYHKAVNGALSTVLIPNAQNAELKSLLEIGLKLFQEHQLHAEHLAASLK